MPKLEYYLKICSTRKFHKHFFYKNWHFLFCFPGFGRRNLSSCFFIFPVKSALFFFLFPNHLGFERRNLSSCFFNFYLFIYIITYTRDASSNPAPFSRFFFLIYTSLHPSISESAKEVLGSRVARDFTICQSNKYHGEVQHQRNSHLFD